MCGLKSYEQANHEEPCIDAVHKDRYINCTEPELLCRQLAAAGDKLFLQKLKKNLYSLGIM